MLVVAAIAMTSEYRFGTIRTTFQATADRTRVLWTKAAMIGAGSLPSGTCTLARTAVGVFFGTVCEAGLAVAASPMRSKSALARMGATLFCASLVRLCSGPAFALLPPSALTTLPRM